jgi:hypothetical protein
MRGRPCHRLDSRARRDTRNTHGAFRAPGLEVDAPRGPVYDLLKGTHTLEADLYLAWGVLVEATGAEGEELLFVGLEGWTRDYDHRAYYEYLFSRATPSAEFKLLFVFLLVAAAVRRSQGAGGGPVRRETSIGVSDE